MIATIAAAVGPPSIALATTGAAETLTMEPRGT